MFINKLLEFNPSRRYTADKALKHPWITRCIYDTIPKTHLEIWKTRAAKKKIIEVSENKIKIIKNKSNKFYSIYF